MRAEVLAAGAVCADSAGPPECREPAVEAAVLRRRSEPEACSHPGPSAREVLARLERVVSERRSEAVLVWPQRPEGVAVFHALAALGRIAECDGQGLATLFFPWCRNTGATQRTLLVDREYLVKATLPALNRVIRETGDRSYGYLMALHSLKHMLSSGKKNTRWKKALQDDPGVMHPSLFEIMPQIGITGSGTWGYEDQFLKRLRRLTWIDQRKEYLETAGDPSRTPFFLFGVHAEALRIRLWRDAGLDARHGGRRPDLIFVDLTRRARRRLDAGNWRARVKRFLALTADLYAQECPPVFAVTDDVFVLQALRWEILKEHDVRRGTAQNKKPASSRLVLSAEADPLSEERIVAGGPIAVTAEVYGADVLNFVDFGLKLRRKLLEDGEAEIAATVTTAFDVLQNLIGLPGYPKQLMEFLTDNYERFEREGMRTRFDRLAPRGKIRSALQLGLAGASHKQLTEFLSAFDKLCAAADSHNPGCRLFDECIRGAVRKSTRSIFVFSSELLRGFAEWRIETDASLADVREHLGRKIMLVDRREAIEELEFSRQEQQLFRRIVFVEPAADDLLHVLTRPWLPEKIIVLANLARAEQTIRRIRILLDLEGVEAVREKLQAVEAEFLRVLDGRAIDIPDLDASPPVPRLGMLDLTGASGTPAGPTRIIGTSGDFRIRAYDGSEFAQYDPDAMQPFSRCLGKDLVPGSQICVFSPDFVDAAREKLNLTANASEVLALYHKDVAQAAQRLPGADIGAKAEALRARMERIDPSLSLPGLQAVRSWIDVADLQHVARDEVRPQAPRLRSHYACLMKALGIGDDVARYYFDLGVFWTRSMRIRNGAAFHQVFMGILIEPHAIAARLPAERRHEVWKIFETAEHHVVTVVANDRENDGDESG